MTTLAFKKVNALPGTLAPSTLYFVANGDGTHVDIHLSTNDGTSAKRIYTGVDIDAKISAAIAASGSGSTGAIVSGNAVTRYEALSSTGLKVHCVSSGTEFSNLSWIRATTSLTVNHIAHGRAVGDRVIIKDANALVLNSLIASVTTDSYTVPCLDSGAASGTAARYVCGFKFAHNSETVGALTGGVLSLPSGNYDIQLMSMRLHVKANSRTGTIYDLTIPTSAYNPAGANTSNDDVYVPTYNVRSDADTMSVIGNTIAMNQTGSYSTFRFGALGATTSGQLIMLAF